MLIYALIALVWLIAIVACLAMAILHGFRLLSGSKHSSTPRLIWALLAAVIFTLPLWLDAAFLEVQCQLAGLSIKETTSASDEGIFWRSHAVDPKAYSNGFRLGSDPLRQSFAINSLRALAEGRLAYVELPYGPLGDPDNTINQKLYVASRSTARSQCLHTPLDSAYGRLPAEYCVAWQTVQNLQTRYEVIGYLGEGQAGTKLSIHDRAVDRTLGAVSYVRETRSTETFLSLWGIRSLQPRSCRASMTDVRPAAMIIALVFRDPNGKTIAPNQLEVYDKSPWIVNGNLSAAEDAVPEGRAGIEYWIAQGRVRRLQADDIALWRSANGSNSSYAITNVPDHVYLIDGPITLPADLYGGNAVVWVLRAGQSIPVGPRGHSTFLMVGKGCLWGPSQCR